MPIRRQGTGKKTSRKKRTSPRRRISRRKMRRSSSHDELTQKQKVDKLVEWERKEYLCFDCGDGYDIPREDFLKDHRGHHMVDRKYYYCSIGSCSGDPYKETSKKRLRDHILENHQGDSVFQDREEGIVSEIDEEYANMVKVRKMLGLSVD